MTGKTLLAKRVAKGLNQMAVAAESGVPLSYISLLESDERLEEYRQLAAAAIEKLAPGAPKKRRTSKAAQPQAIAA